MTIDEAIVSLRKSASKSLDYEWQREQYQLAEWLELLKWYEQGMEDIPSESGVLPKDVYHAGYNKAIDDFAEKLKSECRGHYVDCDPYFGGITDSILYEDDIEEIAEQLKAGGKE